jgi:RimJ/RimL family protein N-acetyltransferase
MYWRRYHKEYESGKGEKNRDALSILINNGYPLGVLAFEDDQLIGWCSISPKNDLIRLQNSRLFNNPETMKSTWSITCIFIHKHHRNKGLSTTIISGAVDYAFKNGAFTIEAYPILPKNSRMPSAFAWVGFVNAFKKAGFKKIKQVSKGRLIMRLSRN